MRQRPLQMICFAICVALVALGLPYLRLGFKLLVMLEMSTVFSELYKVPNMIGKPFNDDTCTLLAGEESGEVFLRGGEDMALWRDGIAIIAAGDLSTAFQHNVTGAKGTGIFAADLRAKPQPIVRQLDLIGLPSNAFVIGHGIYVSNRTSRVYLINHGDLLKSHVDVFDIAGSDFASLKLTLRERISSDRFPYHGINDVVEGAAPNEVFVSIWRAFGSTPSQPAFGSANDQASTGGRVACLYLGPGWGSLGVLHCLRNGESGSWSCVPTEAWGLPSANGLTISPDKKMLLVSVPECRQVFRYRIDGDGIGRPKLREIKPPYKFMGDIDNLEWDEATNRIFLPYNPTRNVAELAAIDASANPAADGYPVGDVLLRHDFNKLAGFSAGFQYGEAVLAGSPFHNGVLYCSKSSKSAWHFEEAKPAV